ncbi:muscarinic acetylcholine receptor DM1-like isoform X2 [Temnothorax nylanderi]
MIMISIIIDKQLQTISNYFVFSLAMSDFAIGLISMPFFTMYKVLGYWLLGPHVCDTWLALDYLTSNASVLNLLIISFNRYFSVTRPLIYRVKRTTTKAAVMIGSAWGISLLLWPPWIYAWPYIEGTRTVPNNACYIQFIETNHYITFGTAIAAFYVPVLIMCIHCFRIWRETKKRNKELPNLQADKQAASKRSNSSDEGLELEEIRIQRNVSSPASSTVTRRSSQMPGILNKQPNKKKKLLKVQFDTKATKMLMAILAAFVLTWTPYNVLVLIKSICSLHIPQRLWDFCYYLCYINSTVNPVLYALCNPPFRKTYVRILKRKWHSRTARDV